MGSVDHCCSWGQAKIATEKARDKYDLIVVQEKLDGSNVCIAKIGGVLYPLNRAGYPTKTSPYKQHQIFHEWAMRNYDRFDKILQNGERICGEWLLQAHGTRYNLKHESFVVFDILGGQVGQLTYDKFIERVNGAFITPHIVHIGSPISVSEAMECLGDYGFHGAFDKVEGVVYRIERKGKVEFLCKYVRPDKKDGCYLESETGGEPVWNCYFKRLANGCDSVV